MNSQICPNCNVQVVPTATGSCPSCRYLIHNEPGESVAEVSAPSEAEATPVIILEEETLLDERTSANPFQAPKSVLVPIPLGKPGRKKEPFSHQAAKFSAYTPAVLCALGMCVQAPMKDHQGTETGMQMAWALAGLSILTTLSAFVFGFVGLFGGIARRAGPTIVYALIGILFNAAMIVLWASVILEIFGQR